MITRSHTIVAVGRQIPITITEDAALGERVYIASLVQDPRVYMAAETELLAVTRLQAHLARYAHAARPLRVLVVDDDVFSSHIAQTICRTANCEVESVTSGEDALELMRTRSFDLVLTDVTMPGIDGFRLVRRLRALKGDRLTVIAVTGVDQREWGALHAAGVNEVVAKPYHAEMLRGAIERARIA